MLFNFQMFVSELRNNPDKKEVVTKYEEHFGPIEGAIQDQLWYQDYLSKFNTIQYIVPAELTKDFDWNLLMQLVGGSFSSEGSIQKTDVGNFEFVISAKSGDQTVVKKASELWGFQVLRLFEIYSEEQMNLQTLTADDQNEREAIMAQRKILLPKWNSLITSIEKENIIEDSLKGLHDIIPDLH